MEDNGDSDYIPEDSEDSDHSSKPRRRLKSRVKNDSFDSNSDTNFTPKRPKKRKRKIKRSQSKKVSTSVIYQCSLCSFQTNLKYKLKRHFNCCSKGLSKTRIKFRYKVTEGAKFLCEYCPFETGTLKYLLSHKQCHAKLVASGLIECSHCNLTFFTVEECKKHMDFSFLGSSEKNQQNRNDNVDVSASKNVTIQDCSNEEQPTVIDEEISSRKVPKEQEKVSVVCDDFDCELVKKNGLYSCPCEKFQTHYRSNYLRHLKLIHNVKRIRHQGLLSINTGEDEKKPLICLQCQRQAVNQLQLAVHMAFDHVKPGCPFTCLKPGCDFETDHKDELKGHLMDMHRLKESVFRPLADANSKVQQAAFTCSKCLHETKNEVYLKAHNLTSHSKDAEAPFQCPWPECKKYLGNKRSLRHHLKMIHGMDVKGGSAVPPDQGWDPDGPLLSCRNCGHKSRTDFQMLIHRTFYHHPRSQKRFGCPLPECYFVTYYKHHLRRHLKRVHKLGMEHFQDYGVVRPENKFEWDVPEDVVEGLDENLDEVSVIDCDYEFLSTPTINGIYNCKLCAFTTECNRTFDWHQSRVHHKRECDVCKKTVWGKYQWFWHNYSLHNRQKNCEFYQWYLRCELCWYEGTTTSSYKHGATHELPRVMFRTLFRNVPSGHVSFHYAQYESANVGLGNQTHEEEPRGERDIEDCVVPSDIKVLDWTLSHEKGNVSLHHLGTEEAITIQFVDDSDAEAETQDNNDSPNQDDSLLIKISEFLTCKECNFETQDAALLKVHGAVAHVRWKTSQTKQFRCLEHGCPFQSKYLDSLKRHLMKIHNYDRKYLWPVETMWKMKEEDDDDCVPGSGKKHATGSHAPTDPIWNPDDHQYSKRKDQNPRLSADRGRKNGISKFGKSKFMCPNLHCLFDTYKKRDLKRHLEVFHQMEENNVVELEDTVMSMKTIACTKCNFQAKDDEEFKRHFRTKHRRPDAQTVTAGRGYSQEPPKWRLKCSHCPFQTLLKKAAYRHGAQHYQVPIVTFHKYANNQRRGVLRYRYSNRRHNVGSKPDNKRHHMPNVENIESHRIRKAKPVETRLLRNEGVARSAKRPSDSPDLGPSKHMKVKDDSRSNKKENNRIRVEREKEDFVVADTDSDGDQAEAGLESPKNCSDIETEVKHTTIDSDWISALEDDILDDDNEVIRIEITEDVDENLDPIVEPVTETEATTLRIKCKNQGCDYVCHNTDDIQKHAESCAKSLSLRNQSKGEFACALCETSFLNKETFQNHVRYDHLINQKAKPKPKTKLLVKQHITSDKISGRVSFKCWMCSVRIVDTASLRSHTHVHAHEENNFDLKVRFSKYKGDTRVGTIVINADPAYVPRISCDVPPLWIRSESPVFEFDPELPVFACAECNFKTNKEAELTRHKNLHWSEEKAAAFEAQKWFTCGECYFKCLGRATFNEHADKHKSRANTKIDDKKLGKDS